MKDPYLYDGLEATLYDRLDELSDFDDLAFYQWFAESNGGNALDLGCGTGRALIPLAQSGIDVVGLEYAPKMVEICRENLRREGLSSQVVEGDMRNFDFGETRFSTIMIPGYSIQLLLDDEDRLNCLNCCRRHLAIGGQLIVPIYMPWDMIWEGRESMPLEERRVVENKQANERLCAYQGWRLDTEKQRLQLLNRFERQDLAGNILDFEDKEMTLRWDMPHEMLKMFSEVGFSDVSQYGDFGFEPPDEESESIIYVARI